MPFFMQGEYRCSTGDVRPLIFARKYAIFNPGWDAKKRPFIFIGNRMRFEFYGRIVFEKDDGFCFCEALILQIIGVRFNSFSLFSFFSLKFMQ